ncbi:cytochrome P450 4C1-like [Belonocnema kinseyi]|uniref:cytochrome P450 4C1-like n=1 Tax=Belonocnema kinseyi TaxID=2817044 RepID=UPI00143D9C9A|nr:cytochrome P450 4C1-like [Belonocnema kinseyi]
MSVIFYLSIGILSIILLVLFDYVNNFQFYKDGDKLPGPKAYPIIGNAHFFLGMDVIAAHEKLLEIAEEYASPFRGWLGNQLFIIIHEPDQMKTILTSPKSMGKASLYRLLRPWLGNALLLAPVPMWRVHRKLIQPAFSLQILRKFVHIFDKHSKSMVKKMEEELDGGEFEVRSYLVPFSLNVALEASMGLSETFDPKMYAEFGVCVDRVFELIMQRGFRPWLHPDKIFNLTKMSNDFYRSIKGMHRISHTIIAKKKNEFEKHGEVKKDKIKNQREGFLELLLDLQDKQKFSDQQICDEVNFMVMAAYDTVSVGLQFALLMLAHHPDVQEKVYQELKHIYGDVIPENVLITIDDLREMRYTERMIQESMRLFPPVAFVLRKVEEDLDVGGYTMPKGCTAFCSIAKIHRDEKYWPDPLKFDPDRFLPEEVAKRNPYCYLPFSGGPRNCIGSLHAIMEMKTALARILLKFIIRKKHIEPIKNIRQKAEIISHPLKPIKIEIVRRLPKT